MSAAINDNIPAGEPSPSPNPDEAAFTRTPLRADSALLYAGGRLWTQVVELAQQALALNPDDRLARRTLRDAYNWRGVIYRQRGWYEEAVADFSHAIDVVPTHPSSYNNRGRTYDEMCLYEQALADYDRAIKLGPTHVNIYNNRGNTYYVLHEYDKAIADYNYMIQHDWHTADAYYNRGRCYQRQGLLFKAIADYQQALWSQSGKRSRVYHPAEQALRELGVISDEDI